LRAFLAVVGPALREDRRFVGVVVTRLLFGAGVLVYPFYFVYAEKALGFGAEQIGLFLSAQVIGGILGGMIYGQLADRFGTRATIRAAVPIAALAPALALAASFLGGLPEIPRLAVTAGVFVAVGLTFSSYVLGFINYVLEIAPEHDRSAYGGLFNTINGMLLVVPALAGWFLEATSYQLLFAVALATLALAFVASLALGEVGHGRANAGR
jgi:MFS family permease